MGTSKRRRADRAGRPPMRSPGRPPVGRREHRQRFWEAIARGLSSEDARWRPACRRRSGRGGSAKAGGMPPISLGPVVGALPVVRRARGDRDLARAGAGCVRSLGGWAGRRRRSRASCAATPRPVVAVWSIARRPPSGTPSGAPGARRSRSSPRTTRCGSTCRTGSRVINTGRDGRSGPQVRWIGRRHGRRQDRRWATSWSPEQIANRLPVDFPDDESMRISHEAIYQALYVQGRGALRRELVACLRTGRALRVPRARTGGAARSSSPPRS